MAHEETANLPTTDIPQLVPQSTHFLHKTKPSRANGGSVEAASQSCGTSPGPCQENAVINQAEIEDDEVQFVFSLPRRKRKKRKGYYDLSFSSWLDSDDYIGLNRLTSHQLSGRILRPQQVLAIRYLALYPCCRRGSVEEAPARFGSLNYAT
jgi:hypothetical protein